ncbi:serine O-acetyltransferase [Rubripirellula reticaptiva]|uniref:serine O-acetyltransferase n=1 Tax=Rubripirellula reticaptiva TaxID=2528013 RepID=UPI001FECE6E2|nr:serine O-acetyltransferase [Rubripirellula reticaptiva]
MNPSVFTLIREDYRANGSDWHRPGFRALATYRYGVWRMSFKYRIVRILLGVFYKVCQRRCMHVYGIELPYSASIGRNVTIEHQHGIVVHGASVIGDGCIIRQGVTLGIRDEKCLDQAPRLGKRVSVGAGAKILGDVTIGDDAKIGANAVVLCDVPAGQTAVGIPARVICKKTHSDRDGFDNGESESQHASSSINEALA